MNSDNERYNYLAAAEMSEEDNCNQIDGVPNNTTKPSILERLREYEAQRAVHIAENDERSGKSAGRER